MREVHPRLLLPLLGIAPIFGYTSSVAIGLIIFDLDGTLIDSIGDITHAVNHAFHPCGITTLLPGEVAGMIGEGAHRLIERIMEKYDLNEDRDYLVERYIRHYSAHLTDNTTLYPHAKKMLDELALYKKALLSNKTETLARRILDAFSLSPYFDMVVGPDTLPHRKPSPLPILHVLSALDMPPGKAIMVGDSEIDIMAGKASSIKTVAVTHGYGRQGFEAEADFVIHDLRRLPDVVKSIP